MQFLCNFSGPRTAYKFLQINCFCCRMGVSLSCPFAKCNNVEDGLDSIIAKSINFAYDEIKTSPVRSASFTNEDDLEPTILKSNGSKENMTIEAPRLSFKRKHMENTTSTETLVFDKEIRWVMISPSDQSVKWKRYNQHLWFQTTRNTWLRLNCRKYTGVFVQEES